MSIAIAIAAANRYFPHYPGVPTFFVTSDELVFVQKDHAEMHARHLDANNPKVYTVERKAAEEPVAEEAVAEAKDKVEVEAAAPKVQKAKK